MASGQQRQQQQRQQPGSQGINKESHLERLPEINPPHGRGQPQEEQIGAGNQATKEFLKTAGGDITGPTQRDHRASVDTGGGGRKERSGGRRGGGGEPAVDEVNDVDKSAG